MPFYNDPEHWYNRADEASVVVELLKDPVAKRFMQNVAESYLCLAKRAEQARNDSDRRETFRSFSDLKAHYGGSKN